MFVHVKLFVISNSLLSLRGLDPNWKSQRQANFSEKKRDIERWGHTDEAGKMEVGGVHENLHFNKVHR